jgi:hypothetical protein
VVVEQQVTVELLEQKELLQIFQQSHRQVEEMVAKVEEDQVVQVEAELVLLQIQQEQEILRQLVHHKEIMEH